MRFHRDDEHWKHLNTNEQMNNYFHSIAAVVVVVVVAAAVGEEADSLE